METLRINTLTLAILLIWPMMTSATVETPIHLQYRVDEPVTQRSRVTVDITQQKPNGAEYLSAFQEAEAQISLDKEPNSPPYELTLVLTQLRVGLEAEDKTVMFDSQSPQTSPLIAALSKVIGEPIRMTVGEHLQILNTSSDLQRLMKDLKLMGGFNINNLISEMVQQRFALANQALEVGKSYEQTLKRGSDGNSPVELTYRIVEISPTEVRATVEGNVPASTMQLIQGQPGSNVMPSALKVTGAIEGKVVWNRENALVYRSKLNYLYRGVIADRGRDTPFELRMTHQDVSRLP